MTNAFGSAAPARYAAVMQFRAESWRWSRASSLRGIHNMPLVAQLHNQLPEVAAGELTGGPGDGPTWCIGRDGSDYEYVIDRAMGGCSSGCREHEAHHFSSAVAGEATPLEIWLSADGEPPPDWYTRLCP